MRRATRTTTVLLTAAAVATSLVLTGCGTETPVGGAADDEPITPRAVAAVALDHLPGDTTHRGASYVDAASPRGSVGAELRYGGGEGDDGDLVEVLVVPLESVPEDTGCGNADHCVTDDGVQVSWEQEVPEEDPGLVHLSTRRDGARVSVMYAGPAITGDPREQELPISFADLMDVVRDPRLALRATDETLRAGEELDDWAGGEPDPATLDLVTQSPRSLAVGWFSRYGQDWAWIGESPLTQRFGPGAVGGRIRIGADSEPVGPAVLDVLAAPDRPAWVDECPTGWTCLDRGGIRVLYLPAQGDEPGEAWLVGSRTGNALRVSEDTAGPGGPDTVAIRVHGPRIPVHRAGALQVAGFHLWRTDVESARDGLALVTDRAGKESAEAQSGTLRP